MAEFHIVNHIPSDELMGKIAESFTIEIHISLKEICHSPDSITRIADAGVEAAGE
jgi:hypothetical protein